jgi:hypothetical protein
VYVAMSWKVRRGVGVTVSCSLQQDFVDGHEQSVNMAKCREPCCAQGYMTWKGRSV